jgi:HPt (histidine-containing phosphotransfer) domain-containing protein
MTSFDRAQFDALARALGEAALNDHLESFTASMPASLLRMASRLAAGDLEGLGRECHRLRGFTGSFGAVGLVEAIAALEAACQDEDLRRCSRLIGPVRQAAAEAQAAIIRHIAERAAAGARPSPPACDPDEAARFRRG